jgi:hypothetical protein
LRHFHFRSATNIKHSDYNYEILVRHIQNNKPCCNKSIIISIKVGEIGKPKTYQHPYVERLMVIATVAPSPVGGGGTDGSSNSTDGSGGSGNHNSS